jgi:hypothetical protein
MQKYHRNTAEDRSRLRQQGRLYRTGGDNMSLADFLLPLLIAASAVAYGIFAGRARASRLRSLHQDVSNSRMRGYLVIVAVIGIIIATFIF